MFLASRSIVMINIIFLCFQPWKLLACLDEGEIAFLKPICRSLNMPLQPPVIATFHKKATKEEPTGRIVEYRSRSLTHPSFVTLDSKAPQEITTFGKTEDFFTYRSVKFAVVSRFECSTHSLYGLTRITYTN